MDPTTAALEKEHEAVSLILCDCSGCSSWFSYFSVLVAVRDIICQPSEIPSVAKLHCFLFDFLDHQSEVCGQNPDRKL